DGLPRSRDARGCDPRPGDGGLGGRGPMPRSGIGLGREGSFEGARSSRAPVLRTRAGRSPPGRQLNATPLPPRPPPPPTPPPPAHHPPAATPPERAAPPPTPADRSRLAAIEDRYPDLHTTTSSRSFGTREAFFVRSSSTRCSAPSMWPAFHSAFVRTSTTCGG